jgi:polysaccharide export outer membrane protein
MNTFHYSFPFLLKRVSLALGLLMVTGYFPSPLYAQTEKSNLFDYTPDPSAPNLLDFEADASPSFSIRSERGNNLYRLGPGDQINVTVVNVPEFSGDQTILNDGTIRLALIGNVTVQGLTLDQAEAELSKRYVGTLKDPAITLRLLQSARPLTVTVIGAVNKPGSYSFNVTEGEVPSVISTIQKANGITQMADVRNIEVRRLQPGGTSQVATVDLWKLLQQGGDENSNLILLDGDTISVASAEVINPEEAALLSRANFAPGEIRISVVGEVSSPGQITAPSGIPLNQAVLMAGGLTKRANSGSIELLRLNPNGTVSRKQVALNFSEGLNEEGNPPLQDSDVVFVARSGAASVGDSLEVLTAPLLPLANILSILRGLSVFGSN